MESRQEAESQHRTNCCGCSHLRSSSGSRHGVRCEELHAKSMGYLRCDCFLGSFHVAMGLVQLSLRLRNVQLPPGWLSEGRFIALSNEGSLAGWKAVGILSMISAISSRAAFSTSCQRLGFSLGRDEGQRTSDHLDFE